MFSRARAYVRTVLHRFVSTRLLPPSMRDACPAYQQHTSFETLHVHRNRGPGANGGGLLFVRVMLVGEGMRR